MADNIQDVVAFLIWLQLHIHGLDSTTPAGVIAPGQFPFIVSTRKSSSAMDSVFTSSISHIPNAIDLPRFWQTPASHLPCSILMVTTRGKGRAVELPITLLVLFLIASRFYY